ncbi:MAG: DUF3617 family protein [Parasphingopyxis sp.]|uniref:DUF3617 domain-containing protein n=1 Tax=Parasphingopyxis sp. TaxID=1920299 RepID=UPI0032EBC6C7
MKALLVPVAAALTVAGCSSGPDRIDAGEWSMSTEVLSIEGPGVSDAMSEAAASQPPQTASTCVTEEMAANDFGGLLNPFPGNEDACEFARSDVADGSMAIEAECTMPDGSAIGFTADGSFDRQSMEGDMEVRINAPGAGEVTVTSRFSGERTGDC